VKSGAMDREAGRDRNSRKRSISPRSSPGFRPRMHHVADGHVAESPDHVALIEDGSSWSYRKLDRSVKENLPRFSLARRQTGDRVIIVSEKLHCACTRCCWRRAGSMHGRSSPIRDCRRAKLDQIRDHSGARRVFFTVAVSKEAAGSALFRLWLIGPTRPAERHRRSAATKARQWPARSFETATVKNTVARAAVIADLIQFARRQSRIKWRRSPM